MSEGCAGTGIWVRGVLHKFGMMTSLDFEGIPNCYLLYLFIYF
jgi:hypothetical protein